MKNKIIFGTACYLMNNIIRIRKRTWTTTLPSGKAWKQPYVACLNGIDQAGQFKRNFMQRNDVNLNGVDAFEWYLPEGTMVEFGWCFNNLDSYDADTHYLMMVDGKWIEITKDQMTRNMENK